MRKIEMSENSTPAKNGDGIHVNHDCEHLGCGKWGGFGFARSKADSPRWWCWEHYPHKNLEPAG